MKKLLVLLIACLALTFTIAACGDDDDDGGGGSAATTTEQMETTAPKMTKGSELSLSAPADGSLQYDKTALEASAGEVTVDFDNKSADVPHNVTIEGTDAATETVTGGTASLTTELEPGEYTFFCSIPGHREAGMEGTLTVK